MLSQVAIHDTNRAHISGGCHVGICAQGLGDWTVTVDRSPWLFAAFLLCATTLQFIFIDVQAQLTLAHVDGDGVAVFDQADNAAVCSLRRDVADRQPRSTTGETAIRDRKSVV